jgi:hypothetical protein
MYGFTAYFCKWRTCCGAYDSQQHACSRDGHDFLEPPYHVICLRLGAFAYIHTEMDLLHGILDHRNLNFHAGDGASKLRLGPLIYLKCRERTGEDSDPHRVWPVVLGVDRLVCNNCSHVSKHAYHETDIHTEAFKDGLY